MLIKRNCSLKVIYCMILLIWHSQKDKDRNQISGCQGLGDEGVTIKGVFWAMGQYSFLIVVVQESIHVLNLIEFYSKT